MIETLNGFTYIADTDAFAQLLKKLEIHQQFIPTKDNGIIRLLVGLPKKDSSIKFDEKKRLHLLRERFSVHPGWEKKLNKPIMSLALYQKIMELSQNPEDHDSTITLWMCEQCGHLYEYKEVTDDIHVLVNPQGREPEMVCTFCL